MNVDRFFREFLTGRRPFEVLMDELRAIDASAPEGRAEIEQCLTELVNTGALPNDLGVVIRGALGPVRSARPVVDILDPPTEPWVASREPARPGPASQAAPPSGEPLAASPLPAMPLPDPYRDKVDEVVLGALAADFRNFKRRDPSDKREGEKAADRQLDAALADFRGARLRRDAAKASEGTARPFDYTVLAASGAEQAGVGTILKNRFVLDREIGRGGMGIVYRAVDRRRLEAMHQQPYVAVKLMTGDIRRDPDALRALEAEARRAQELAHPHIVTTYDFDRDGAHIFIVMELLQGRPLDVVLREHETGFGFEGSRTLIEGICNGLAHAHSSGVIHCDLKPANVFLQETGDAKILDFGIATAGRAGGFDLSSLNAYTISYASPEVLSGGARDPRDDIYALGCLVYVLVTGNHPFDRASALDARDRGLRPRRPDKMPGPAWRALRRALSFEREQRPKNAAAFRRDYFRRGPFSW